MLNKAEQQLAILCGAERHLQNRLNGTDYHKVNFTNDINGIAAEIAVAKYCNRFPDLSIGPQRGGADLKIAGKTVDVKTTGKNYSGDYIETYNKKYFPKIYREFLSNLSLIV